MNRILVTIAVLSGFLTSLAGPHRSSDPVAILMRTRGRVTAEAMAGGASLPVEKGFFCNSGTAITTGNSGFAEFRLVNSQGVIALAPNTSIGIRRIDADGRILEHLELRAGMVHCDMPVSADSLACDVFTPSGLISLKGTRALVIYDGTADLTTLYNLEGTARVADPDFSDWISVESYGVAYSRASERPQAGLIHPAGLGRVLEVAGAVAELRASPAIPCELRLSASGGGTNVPEGDVVVLAGTHADLMAQPTPGSYFVGWQSIEGTALVQDAMSETTVVVPQTNARIEARFSANPARLTLEADKGGRVSPSGLVLVERDVPLSVRVTPRLGFAFKGWKAPPDVVVSGARDSVATLTVRGSTARAVAQFVKKPVTATILASKGGSVKPAGLVQFEPGSTKKISAQAGKGYRFLRWSVTAGSARIDSLLNPQASIECETSGATVVAVFSNSEVEVEVLAAEHATVTPLGSLYVDRFETIKLQATPTEGYEVTGWRVVDGRAAIEGGEQATARLRTPARIQPIVEPLRYQLSVSSNTVKWGRTFPQGNRIAEHGTPIAVRAVPKKGKYFLRWRLLGGWAQFDSRYQDSARVTLSSGDASIAAEFSATVCSLRVVATPGGTVEPAGLVRNCRGGPIDISALPNPRAAFLGWEVDTGRTNIKLSDSLAVPEQTVTTLGGYTRIRAVFSENAGALTVLTNGPGRAVPEGKRYIVKERWFPIRALPNERQTFVQWVAVSGGDIQFRDPFSAETEAMLSADECTIKALFKSSSGLLSDTGSVAPGMSAVSFLYDQSQGDIDKGLTVSGPLGVPITVTATPRGVYGFLRWQVVGTGAAAIANPTSLVTTITPLSDRVQISALFVPRPLKQFEARFTNSKGESRKLVFTYQ